MSGFASQLVLEVLVGAATAPQAGQLVLNALIHEPAPLSGAISSSSVVTASLTPGVAVSQIVIEALSAALPGSTVSQFTLSALLGTQALAQDRIGGSIVSQSDVSGAVTRGLSLSLSVAVASAVTSQPVASRPISLWLAPASAVSVTLSRFAPDFGPHAAQLVAEVLLSARPSDIAAQLVIAVLSSASPTPRIAQLMTEILIWNYEVTMPSIYPTLPGLDYSVIKRPKWFTGIGTAVSGREVRVAYANAPLWEWDLTYSYLPDQQTASSATASDLKQILGFYLAQSGAFGGFLFLDPDDNQVSGQAIGTTDGTTTMFTLIRTYGGSDGTGTEPIGYVNTSAPFNLYVAGVLQAPSTYDLLSTTPVSQQIRFHSPPAAGSLVSCDMQYYYYVRFKEDQYEFEKFMNNLWSLQTVTLMSLRG